METRKSTPRSVSWDEVYYSDILTDEQRKRIEARVELISTLIKLRNEQGVTQKELAEKTGMTQSTIAKLEGLVNTPRIDTLNELLDPLGYKLGIIPK